MSRRSTISFILIFSILAFAIHVKAASLEQVSSWSFGKEKAFVTGVREGGSDTTNPGHPSVAFDGTNHLLVTVRTMDRSNTVTGALLSQNGTVLKSFAIAEATPWYQPPAPALAFGRTNHLVTFQSDYKIFAKRISPEGVLLDPADGILISGEDESSSHGAPAVAWDGERFLVVWQRYNNYSTQLQIWGAFVDPTGATSKPFAIGRTNRQEHVSIAFGKDSYLVVWEDNRWAVSPFPSSDLVGARVTRSGIVLDPDGFEVCRAPQNQHSAHVTFGATNFFVVWQDERKAGYMQPQIYGTRVSPEGGILDGATAPQGLPISTFSPAVGPRAGFDGSGYFVSWWVDGYQNFSNTAPIGIYFARLDLNGTLLGDGPTNAGVRISTTDWYTCYGCRVVYPETSFDGTRYLVTYLADSVAHGKDIQGRLISRPGLLRQPRLGNDGCIEIGFEKEMGQEFVLEASTDLRTWQEVGTQKATNTITTFRDCSAPSTGRFYRIRQE